jgi:SAM-dependent methyltransferase
VKDIQVCIVSRQTLLPPEQFKPFAHKPPVTASGKLVFGIKLLLDFQFRTIYRDLKKTLPLFSGKVLDLGAGNAPFRFLLDPKVTVYTGVDLDTGSFFEPREDIIGYDGVTIPFTDAYFDCLLCTEVLEHVPDSKAFVEEMHRVLKNGGQVIVTVPWSARFHFIPHDFSRFTPTALQQLFASFNSVDIRERGTDITVIAAKIVVVFARHLRPASLSQWLLFPLWLLASPLLFLALVTGHISLLFRLGAAEDPLGYTIRLVK